ncbi:unnamed protein product [Heterosigma akashiwo]
MDSSVHSAGALASNPSLCQRFCLAYGQFNALCRKNAILKLRKWWELLLELLIPIVCMYGLIGIKSITEVEKVPRVIPDTSYPIALVSHIANATQYPQVLCGDNNMFYSCDCEGYDGDYSAVWDSHNSNMDIWNSKHPYMWFYSICYGGFNEMTSYAYDDLFTAACDADGDADTIHSAQTKLLELLATADQDTVNAAVGLDATGEDLIVPEASIADRCRTKMLALVPAESGDADLEAAVAALEAYLSAEHPALAGFLTTQFEDEAALNRYVKQGDYSQDPDIPVVGYAVVLHGASPAWDYAVRGNYTKTDGDYWQRDQPSTEVVLDDFLKEPDELPESQDGTGIPIFQFSRMYSVSNALAVQQMVDAFIFDQEGVGAAPPTVRLAPFPSRAYETSGFWESVSFVFAFFMVLAMLYPMLNMIKALVQEKELRLKEGMRMMGLSGPAHVLSWWCHFVIFFLALSILLSMVTAPLFEYSDSSLIFWYFMWFFASCVSFAFFISSFFNKARTASILGTLGFLISLFPYFAVSGSSTSLAAKRGASLLPATAFALGTDAFTAYEDAQIGVTAETAGSSTDNSLPFNDAVGLLFADAVLYGLLAWYFNQVMPSEWGTQRPWYFLVTKSYWCPGLAGRQAFQDADALLAKDESEGNPNVQKVSGDLHAQLAEGSCVALRGLLKVFATPTGPKKAVHDLGLTMYRGQITALLGHNGAGKTTTISMLTGLLAPTGGAAFIQGRDVFTQMKFIRRTLGVCPQHDILYPDLTVREHLRMYAVFKGVPRAALKGAVEKMIVEVGLTEKRNKKAKSLSGGQKRKLSVGIAFIGDSKVVFLDEPTSGMDPYSRRFTWDVIRRNREGRVIVLTTHFMDEADLLGDRVAIMADGQLRCCGTSLFLKSRFGVGYNLTLVKKMRPPPSQAALNPLHEGKEEDPAKQDAAAAAAVAAARDDQQLALQGQSLCDEEGLVALVRGHAPSATLLSNVGAEISFQLPTDASAAFKPLLNHLDRELAGLGVEAYGISVTTLEEVFLRVAAGLHEPETQAQLAKSRGLSRSRSLSAEVGAAKAAQPAWKDDARWKAEAVTGAALFRQHFTTLMVKRFWNYKRDRKAWGFTLLAPALFLLLGLGILQIDSNWTQPSLTIGLAENYNTKLGSSAAGGQQPVFYACNASATCADAQGVMEQMTDATPYDVSDDLSTATDNNSTVWHLNEHLVTTIEDYQASRYGAYYFTAADAAADEYAANVHLNFTAAHAAPAFINALNEAVLKVAGGASLSLALREFPLGETSAMLALDGSVDGFTVTIFMTMAFAFIPAGFAQYVIREREMKTKHQQVVSGVSLNAYWLSSYAWDFCQYLLGPFLLTEILLAAFDIEALVNGDGGGAACLALLLNGLAIVPFTYLLTFFFKSASVGTVLVLILNIALGLLLTMVMFIMLLIPSTQKVAKKLQWLFRLFPPYCFGNTMLSVAFREFLSLIDDAPGSLSPWDNTISGYNLVFLAWEAVVYFLGVLLVERLSAGSNPLAQKLDRLKLRGKRYAPRDPPREEVDADVAEEEDRVLGGGAEGDVIRIHRIRKAFPDGPCGRGYKEAVRGLSLGIPRGQCFGLLGINGAGKTTTLTILSGEQPPTEGAAFLAGLNIAENPEEAHRLIGYCPQFDAIFGSLTGRENLWLYGRLKGIPKKYLGELIEQTIQMMSLTEYADRLSGTYSGGNKRKLSVGIAMIGGPELVFLDEPSTGMDPVARRFMWDVITKISTERQQCAVILTTHSMEECEALCTRIGIMVGGRLRCLGSAQRLKSRFGLGFQLELGLRLPSEVGSRGGVRPAGPSAATAVGLSLAGAPRTGAGALLYHELLARGGVALGDLVAFHARERRAAQAEAFVADTFKGAVLREKQSGKLRFEYPPQPGLALGEMFGALEDRRAQLGVEEYALSQTTLEQVFNFFAGQQEEETGRAAGIQGGGPAAAVAAQPPPMAPARSDRVVVKKN